MIKVGLKRVNLDERVLLDDYLRGAPFVRAVGEGPLPALLEQSQGRRFAHGARIFLEGDGGDSLLFVLKGEVRLSTAAGAVAGDIALVHKGEVMGEGQALGDSAARTFSAEAVGEVELVEIPRAVLSAFTGRCPNLAPYLRQVAQARAAAGDEMADFLKRW